MTLLRRPITWLIVLEVVVVAGLAVAAVSVASSHLSGDRVAAAAATVRARGLGSLPVVAGLEPSPPGAVAVVPTPRASGPTPGLALSSGFFGREMRTINRDESAWERAQWAITQAVLAFARAYLDEVVLPGVRAAAGRP